MAKQLWTSDLLKKASRPVDENTWIRNYFHEATNHTKILIKTGNKEYGLDSSIPGPGKPSETQIKRKYR